MPPLSATIAISKESPTNVPGIVVESTTSENVNWTGDAWQSVGTTHIERTSKARSICIQSSDEVSRRPRRAAAGAVIPERAAYINRILPGPIVAARADQCNTGEAIDSAVLRRARYPSLKSREVEVLNGTVHRAEAKDGRRRRGTPNKMTATLKDRSSRHSPTKAAKSASSSRRATTRLLSWRCSAASCRYK